MVPYGPAEEASSRPSGLNATPCCCRRTEQRLHVRSCCRQEMGTVAIREWVVELNSSQARRRGLRIGRARLGHPASAVVLAEALTGDHRRDFHANRLLRACQIRDVTEPCVREAARLRTATGHAAAISATDAIVASYASTAFDPVVLTSVPRDMAALAEQAARPITIAPV
jgi:hypothetical protein